MNDIANAVNTLLATIVAQVVKNFSLDERTANPLNKIARIKALREALSPLSTMVSSMGGLRESKAVIDEWTRIPESLVPLVVVNDDMLMAWAKGIVRDTLQHKTEQETAAAMQPCYDRYCNSCMLDDCEQRREKYQEQ